MKNKKILLGLTTTPWSDWRGKIEEIKKFNISELALFPTFLKKREREELYKLLEDTSLKSVPHIHLRTDMDIPEIDYLVERYNTKVLNIHSLQQYPLEFDYSKYQKMIYLENTEFMSTDKELEKYAGLCIDFSHLESAIISNYPAYKDFENKIKKFGVGCCHISAIKKYKDLHTDPRCTDWVGYDHHYLDNLNEVDYIKKYIKYLPDLISIELENSFEEQMKIREYLKKII